jgi:putative transposase
MERRFVPGTVVEHAGARWRVERALGADAVLLRGDAGEVTSADPARITFPDELPARDGPREGPLDELRYTEAEWAEAERRRELLGGLARLPRCTRTHVAEVAAALGVTPRRAWALLRRARATGGDITAALFLPVRPPSRRRRLRAEVEAIVAQATDRHYAKPTQPSLHSLWEEVDRRCRAAGLASPCYKAVQTRVRARDQRWLTRRREGEAKARSLRLLTGSHPGAEAPWARVQIDSTPGDVRLVREEDRAVIGRATVTFALDLYSRAILGFSVSLQGASTITVATCLAHACLPKADWLAARDLASVHWPVWGKPVVLEYDQGPENVSRGIQRGLRLQGIKGKVRPKGRPERHGHVERLIGTMMRRLHERRGTTFSNVNERGETEPERLACLSLPELEQILALEIGCYHALRTGRTWRGGFPNGTGFHIKVACERSCTRNSPPSWPGSTSLRPPSPASAASPRVRSTTGPAAAPRCHDGRCCSRSRWRS